MFRALLLMTIAGISGPGFAQDAGFFRPFVSKEFLRRELQTHAAPMYSFRFATGGEAILYAAAENSADGPRFFVQKEFLDPEKAAPNRDALLRFADLEERGLLAEFHAAKVLDFEAGSMRLELIEGRSLNELATNYHDRPGFEPIWKRYMDSLRIVAANLEGEAYDQVDNGGFSLSCDSGLVNGQTITGREGISFYGRTSGKIELDIDPINVIVEAGTGKFFIVDPF